MGEENFTDTSLNGLLETYRESGREAAVEELEGMLTAARCVGLRRAAEIARGKETEAAGQIYQANGDGDFWDKDSIYGMARENAAAAIEAEAEKAFHQ